MSKNGFSLLEVLVVIAIVGIAAAAVASRASLDEFGLTRAARLVESELARARLHALARHGRTEVTLSGTRLRVAQRGGPILSRVDLAAHAFGQLDSVRLRPTTIRFNARGHGSLGSVKLYRGHREIRLVSNIVGRVRTVRFNH